MERLTTHLKPIVFIATLVLGSSFSALATPTHWTKSGQAISSPSKADVNSTQVNPLGNIAQAGITPMNLSDPAIMSKVTNLALVAVQDINLRSNSLHYQRLAEVRSASYQVVAGTIYYIQFSLIETSCNNTQQIRNLAAGELDTTCPYSGSPTQVCQVSIWDQPWIPLKTIKSSSCQLIN